MRDSIIQFIKFWIVGLSNTVIGYLIYVATLFLLRKFNLFGTIDIYIAQFVMFMLSVLWSYYWNSKKVFVNSKETLLNSLLKTYMTYACTSLLLSEILLLVWTKVFGISEYVAPLISLLVTVPLNYIIHKRWVFNARN